MSTPDVSVVIPTREARHFLPRTLTTALAQEDVSIEVIVVDDGSDGGIEAMPAQLADPRLRVLRHEVPRGVAGARNTGLSAARAEWVAFLDDDDLWSPRKLRTQLEAAAKAGASFAYGAAMVIDEHGNPIHLDHPPPAPGDLPAAMLVVNVMPAPGSNLLAKSALMRDLGGFDEGARFDDWDMWIRLADAAPGADCPEVLTAYRRHRANRIMATQDEALPAVQYLAKKHRALAEKHGVEFDELSCRRWVAWTYRRGGARLQAARMCVATAFEFRTPSDLVRAAFVPFGAWGIYGPRLRRQPPEAPAWLAPYRDGAAISRPPGR